MTWATRPGHAATAGPGLDLAVLRALVAGPGNVPEAPVGLEGAVGWFWIAGVTATLVGATLTVLGFMLQKASHRYTKGNDQWYWSDWRWLLGLSLWLLGQALCWLADGLAPRALLACFNCWNIVVVFALAPPCFGEVVDRKAAVGAAVTVLGCVWVVLSGPRGYQEHTVRSINEAWRSMPLLLVFASTVLYLAAAGIWASFRSPLARSPPVDLAALSAALAWYAVLLSKCVSALVVTSATRENQMVYWEFWLFLAGTLVCAALQMHTLNLGLRAGRSVDVLPAYEALSMTGQIFICGIFFGEFRGFGLQDLVSFASGVSCVLAGVACLVRFGREAEPSEDTPLRPAAALPTAC